MGSARYARGFRDLDVYAKAREVSRSIFDLSKGFPKEETYALTDQVRRSSRSIGAQIAEAWGKRRYERHFISKLTDADAEQMETQHWVEIARDCDYMTDEQACAIVAGLSEVGAMLGSMMAKADRFCSKQGSTVTEDTDDYIIEH